MGITKTLGYMVVTAALFYGGICYERSHAQKEIAALKEQVAQLDSIDYKIGSLLEERVKNPEAVDEALKKYETMVR